MAILKALLEKRNTKVTELKTVLDKAKSEERAMNEEEMTSFNALEKEIKDLDATIEAEKRANNLEIIENNKKKNTEEEKRAVEEAEERAFLNYIKRQSGEAVEERAGEQNLDMGNNGAVIPTTIANRVITKIQEISPILAKSTRFNVKGTLKVPVWGKGGDSADQDITVAYQTEFVDITANSGKFTSVDLTGFLAGALTLIGKSVINNSQVNVANFVINEMAKKIAIFLEKELLVGTNDKAEGALSTTTTMNAGSTSAISADNLIDMQTKIPTAYQADAVWIMHPKTFAGLKKLKDGNGQYLLQSDFSGAMPYRILGKPVHLSDNMPEIASAAKAVLYGDLSGLAVNFREDISIQVLLEKYATQHAVGIVSWFEFDSDVIDNQKLTTLVMSAE
jgi:HK97 family phage major capsid protein